MKMLIISDTHDNIANTLKAIERGSALGAEVLFCCGDFCSPSTAGAMAGFAGPIFCVFGNNDGDKVNIIHCLKEHKDDVTFFRESEGMFELGGRKIAMTHYPNYALGLAKTGLYDLVCFGHDHKARIERHGTCLAINPGTLNPKPSGKIKSPHFAIYDSTAHTAKLYDIEQDLSA